MMENLANHWARHCMTLHRQLKRMGLNVVESANFICSFIAATQTGWEPPGAGTSLNVLTQEMTIFNADQVYSEYGYLTPAFVYVAGILSLITQIDPIPVYMSRTLDNVIIETQDWENEEITAFLMLIKEECANECV